MGRDDNPDKEGYVPALTRPLLDSAWKATLFTIPCISLKELKVFKTTRASNREVESRDAHE